MSEVLKHEILCFLILEQMCLKVNTFVYKHNCNKVKITQHGALMNVKNGQNAKQL